MQARILRGVRVATPQGIGPASVHIRDGTIVALAEYDDVPRLARPEELGKAVLMPGLVQYLPREPGVMETRDAAAGGITTGLCHERGSLGAWCETPGHSAEGANAAASVRGSVSNSFGTSLPGWIDQVLATSGTGAAPPNLALLLATFWTDARNRGHSIESLVEELARAPAERAGIAERKGHIAVGCDADFVIWHPELTLVGQTPPLYGAIRQTILRGQTIFRDGALVGEPSGQWVTTDSGSR